MRFTFDQAKAQAYVRATGRSDRVLPARFDGASLVIGVPSAVLLQYQDASNLPGLMVGQAGQLTATAEGGVTLDELREFLLTLPGLSPQTVRRLRAIDDWRSTLPLPVPASRTEWKETAIAGGQGVVLSDLDARALSAAVWQRDGRVYGVAGPLTTKELLRVAESLQ